MGAPEEYSRDVQTTKNQEEKEMKTSRVSETALVLDTGHACCRGMSWESPYIEFELAGGTRMLWHSDNVESLAARFGFPSLLEMRGRWVNVTANVRPDTSRNDGTVRVQRMISMQDR